MGLYRFSLLLLLVIFLHHLRDSTRRGLWLVGLPPIPVNYWLYICLVNLLPCLSRLFLAKTETYFTHRLISNINILDV